jgi:hypothetical protein
MPAIRSCRGRQERLAAKWFQFEETGGRSPQAAQEPQAPPLALVSPMGVWVRLEEALGHFAQSRVIAREEELTTIG